MNPRRSVFGVSMTQKLDFRSNSRLPVFFPPPPPVCSCNPLSRLAVHSSERANPETMVFCREKKLSMAEQPSKETGGRAEIRLSDLGFGQTVMR